MGEAGPKESQLLPAIIILYWLATHCVTKMTQFQAPFQSFQPFSSNSAVKIPFLGFSFISIYPFSMDQDHRHSDSTGLACLNMNFLFYCLGIKFLPIWGY